MINCKPKLRLTIYQDLEHITLREGIIDPATVVGAAGKI
jgi:hypothetical protein